MYAILIIIIVVVIAVIQSMCLMQWTRFLDFFQFPVFEIAYFQCEIGHDTKYTSVFDVKCK